MFIVLIVLFMLYIHALTLAWSLGYQNFRMSAAMLPFMGILFIFIGTMLRQAKRNFFIGIRTPWTLSSDSVWDKTHQLGSILFMISGAFAFIGAFHRRRDRLPLDLYPFDRLHPVPGRFTPTFFIVRMPMSDMTCVSWHVVHAFCFT